MKGSGLSARFRGRAMRKTWDLEHLSTAASSPKPKTLKTWIYPKPQTVGFVSLGLRGLGFWVLGFRV